MRKITDQASDPLGPDALPDSAAVPGYEDLIFTR